MKLHSKSCDCSMEEPILDTFSYQYPHDLLAVLTETIPKLVKSKKLLISFFRNAGVSTSILKPYENLVNTNRDSVKMYDISREILKAVNEQGDKALSTRRKLLQAVCDFEDFDNCCYENQRNEARGLVWKVREIVNRKDTISRINNERKEERLKILREKEAALAEMKKKKEHINKVKTDLSSLITSKDPHKRGKALEKVLNELFDCYGIKVRDSFVITGVNSEGIVEQIDGVIQFEGTYYLGGVTEQTMHRFRLDALIFKIIITN
ncbi:MAG: hypothetical protein ABFC34_00350 [Methanobacterium sp.]